MSGFLGKTETVNNVPTDVAPLRKGFADFLGKGGFEGLNTGAPDIQAIKDMFTMQTDAVLGQAKESAGNLTGTGYGNAMGGAARKAALEQGGFLANLLEGSKQNNANRLASVLMPFLSTGVSSPTQQHTPGFLDYAIGGAGQAFSGLASGGFFNKGK